MKKRYSDPLILPAMMLTSGGIDIGDVSPGGSATDPDEEWGDGDGTNNSKLSINSQSVPQSAGNGTLISEPVSEEPAIVIEDTPVTGTESETVMDILTGEGANTETAVE